MLDKETKNKIKKNLMNKIALDIEISDLDWEHTSKQHLGVSTMFSTLDMTTAAHLDIAAALSGVRLYPYLVLN